MRCNKPNIIIYLLCIFDNPRNWRIMPLGSELLTRDLDLGFIRLNFENNYISVESLQISVILVYGKHFSIHLL